MANNCCYEMHVRGKKENIEELLQMMQYKHPEKKHFARIFEADVCEIDEEDGEYVYVISGDCAWSVYSCMFDGPWTYYGAYEFDDLLTIIPIESKKLNLDIEIYSEELGAGFHEHFRVKNGEILIDDAVNASSVEWDTEKYPTFEEFAKGENINLACCDEGPDGWYITGGYDWVFEF